MELAEPLTLRSVEEILPTDSSSLTDLIRATYLNLKVCASLFLTTLK